ncbi:hypothetical protein Pla144_16870 [Bythopirellula polymerisocia]|uniref:Uncharacterized protein n=1 Tax=Bythopirellula polymerisocia TaxID=2528003 RepID=A0A5C6D0I5_9BACT|nr:hypothetical protein Pla144_16870 [Bythopirellula polymerisocia]
MQNSQSTFGALIALPNRSSARRFGRHVLPRRLNIQGWTDDQLVWMPAPFGPRYVQQVAHGKECEHDAYVKNAQTPWIRSISMQKAQEYRPILYVL